MFAARHSLKVASGAAAAGLAYGFQKPVQASTKDALASLSARVEGIEKDLGLKPDLGSNYPMLTKKHRSLMAKFMSPEWYAKYAGKSTSMGYTFDMCIQAGVDAPHLGVGITAGDEESYEVFKDFFDLVIEGWHGYKPEQMHKIDMDPGHISMTAEQAKKFDDYVVSTRIRAGRSIRGLPLTPYANRAERRVTETLVKAGLETMTGDLKGTYYGLYNMTAAQETQLQDDHFLFQKPSPRNVLANCGAARDWPDARGIFHNDEKTFLVWINEEDHMRVISMQNGGNVKEVFARFSRGIAAVEKSITASGYEYMYNDHHGNICACPSNLGTGLRASAMLKLPKLYKKMGVHALEDLCDGMMLQARGSKGEHSPPGPNGEFDISNKARIGFSEAELIQQMIDGVDKLIKMEEEC